MAWDDTQTASDTITHTEWNNMVTYIKALGGSRENFDGSDCTLTDGVVNRVLTLTNTALTTDAAIMVTVSGRVVHPAEMTVNHLSASTTITFLNNIFDDDKIMVSY